MSDSIARGIINQKRFLDGEYAFFAVLCTPHILKYITGFQKGKKWDKITGSWAAINGHLNLMKYRKDLKYASEEDPSHSESAGECLCSDVYLLERVIVKGHSDVASFLIDRGLKCSQRIMAFAVGYGDERLIRKLRSLELDFYDVGCLWKACKRGRLELVKKMMPNLPLLYEEEEWEACKRAAKYGHVDVLRFLIDNSFRLDDYVLQVAINNGHYEVVKLVYPISNPKRMTHIHLIGIKKENIEILKYLEARKYEFTVQDLIHAVSNGHANTVEFIASKGITDGPGIITDAITSGNLELVKKIHTQVPMDESDVLKAIRHGCINVVEYALSKGSRIPAKSARQAVKSNNIKMVDFLVSKGVTFEQDSMLTACKWELVNMVMHLASMGLKTDSSELSFIHPTSILGYRQFEFLISRGYPTAEDLVEELLRSGWYRLLERLLERNRETAEFVYHIAVSHRDYRAVHMMYKRGFLFQPEQAALAIASNDKRIIDLVLHGQVREPVKIRQPKLTEAWKLTEMRKHSDRMVLEGSKRAREKEPRRYQTKLTDLWRGRKSDFIMDAETQGDFSRKRRRII